MGKDGLPSYNSISIESLQIKRTLDDDLSTYIGKWGRWQTLIFLLLAILSIIACWHMMVITFYVPLADHWCKPPDLFANWTEKKWKNYSIPESSESPSGWSECSMYDLDYTSLPSDQKHSKEKNPKEVPCQFGWDYDKSQFKETIENEWDLVCEREYLAKTVIAVYNAGFLVGVLGFGQTSDAVEQNYCRAFFNNKKFQEMLWFSGNVEGETLHIGRKKTVILSLGVAAVAAIMMPMVPCLEFFSFLRFLVAAGLSGGGTAGHVILMELCHTSNRALIGSLIHLPWCIGYVMLTGLGYMVPNWRNLQLIISVPLLLFLPTFCLLPESIRWLVTQKRDKEAFRLLKKGAEVNSMPAPNYNPFHFLKDEELQNEEKQSNLFDLFRYPNLRCRTFTLYYNWFAVSFVYYGITLATNSLGGNIFTNFLISAAVEIPTAFTTWLLMCRLGRRWPHFLFMVIGGICLMSTMLIQKGVYPYDWPIITLTMMGKFGFSSSWIIIYLLSAEIYPTVARNVGLGSSSVCARLGSIIAPYVDLLRHVHDAAPRVTYGAVAVVAGLLILLLPETHNQPIPESLEDAEKMGRPMMRPYAASRHTFGLRHFSMRDFLNQRTHI